MTNPTTAIRKAIQDLEFLLARSGRSGSSELTRQRLQAVVDDLKTATEPCGTITPEPNGEPQ